MCIMWVGTQNNWVSTLHKYVYFNMLIHSMAETKWPPFSEDGFLKFILLNDKCFLEKKKMSTENDWQSVVTMGNRVVYT